MHASMRTPLVLLEYPFYLSTACFLLSFASHLFAHLLFLFFVFTSISFHSFFYTFYSSAIFQQSHLVATTLNSARPLQISTLPLFFFTTTPSSSPSFIPNNSNSYTPAFIFLIHLPPTTTTATTTVHSHRHSSLSHNPTDPYLHTRK